MSTAVRPSQGGQIGQANGNAAHANGSCIDQAIDASRSGETSERAEDERANGPRGMARDRPQRIPKRPTQAGCEEDKVEKSQPDGGDGVAEIDERVENRKVSNVTEQS